MTDLEIIQNIFGNNDVSEKWLINMFDVCKSVREAEREACADMVLTLTCMGNPKECFEVAATYIRARGEQ